MATQVTNKIKITVRAFYSGRYEDGLSPSHFFTYQISIHNTGQHAVQLLRRKWYIYEANGFCKEVEGEGVVGEQPLILPGNKYTYQSGCNLVSDMGKMHGFYIMQRFPDGGLLQVHIPEFVMAAPWRLN